MSQKRPITKQSGLKGVIMLNQNIIYSERRESEWKNGFPIGNGRIAGMIYGELDGRIALNHELLYRGINTDREVEPVPPE